MILPVAAFVHLAAQCGPGVHVETLASVAQVESKLDTLAIHDNTSGRSFHPDTTDDAVQIATAIVERRHSADLGLMQVNSANLKRFGMSIPDAFNACKNMGAAADLLVAAYRPPPHGANVQPALRRALSLYNTGNPWQGQRNGYVRRVQVAAAHIIPAVRKVGEDWTAPVTPPLAWDVFARASYDATRRALVMGDGPGLTVHGSAPPQPFGRFTATFTLVSSGMVSPG